MAITASGLLLPTWMDAIDTTQLALDLDLDTHKVALFTNSITPDFDTDTAYGTAPYDANEVSGTGYTAGGQALTGTGLSIAGGNITWDATDISWAGSTLSSIRGALIYADALAGDNGIVLVNLGSDFSTTSGTFSIQWNASGIIVIDGTP